MGNAGWRHSFPACYSPPICEPEGDPVDFKAVLFDMDGVLVDSEEALAFAAIAMFREMYGVIVPRDAFLPFVGAGEDRYIGGPAAVLGLPIDLAAAKLRTYAIYDERAGEMIRILPGAREYILACRDRGLKVALASAADLAKVKINLRVLGLELSAFDAALTGSDVERKKPFPDIYLKAASLAGVDSGDCLVVEDAVNGIRAGIGAGARCLGITTSFSEAELKEAGALWCASDLSNALYPWELE